MRRTTGTRPADGTRQTDPAADSEWQSALSRHLDRPGIRRALTAVWHHPLTLVVAPAGWGKTAAVAQIAAERDAAVAWLRAPEPAEGPAQMLDAVRAAAAPHLDIESPHWATPRAAADALSAGTQRQLLLVVDDADAVWGTAGETTLLAVAARLPERIRMVVVARWSPTTDLSHERAGGRVLDIGPEVLRFRSAEIDRLYTDVFGHPLAAGEAERLLELTRGWPALLRLHHDALQARPVHERHGCANDLPHHSDLRRFLHQHVAEALPAPHRAALLRTAALPRLSPEIVDRDGGDVFDDLLRAGVLHPTEGSRAVLAPAFRHLMVAEARGQPDADTGAWCRRLAGEATQAGDAASALAALAVSEDWSAAQSVLDSAADAATREPELWVDGYDGADIARSDALELARARRAVQRGDLHGAAAQYALIRRPGGISREADLVAEFVRPDPGPMTSRLRRATIEQPDEATDATPTDHGDGTVARSIVALIEGDVDEARRLAEQAMGDRSTAPALRIGAVVVYAAASVLEMPADGSLQAALDLPALAALPALARIARGVNAVVDPDDDPTRIGALAATARDHGDEWGGAVLDLLATVAAHVHRRAAPAPAPGGFDALGAPVLALWANRLAETVVGEPHDSDDGDPRPTGDARAILGGLGPAAPRAATDAAAGPALPYLNRGRSDNVESEGPGERPTLVGRDAEIARMADVARSRHAVIHVVGEPGIGKTALIGAFLRRVDISTAQTVSASARSHDLVRDIARALCERTDPARIRQVAGLGADALLATIRGDASTAEHPVAGERTPLGDAIGRMLQWRAEAGPMTLVVDDVEQASQADVDLLPAILDSVRGAPVVAVLAYRDEQLWTGARRAMAEIATDLTLHLDGLRGRDLEALIRHHLGYTPGAQLLDALERVSGGNPHFLAQALATAAHTDTALVSGEVTVPDSARDLVHQRLADLSGPSRAILRAAAVLGGRVDADILAAVTSATADDVDAALAAGVEANILLDDGRGLRRFGRSAARAVLAVELSESEQGRLHGAAAEWLVAERALQPDSLQEVAGHLLEAGSSAPPRSVGVIARSSDALLAAGRPHQALAICERAMEMFALTTRQEAVVLGSAAAAVRRLSGDPAAADHYRRAVQAAADANDVALLAEASYALLRTDTEFGPPSPRTTGVLREAGRRTSRGTAEARGTAAATALMAGISTTPGTPDTTSAVAVARLQLATLWRASGHVGVEEARSMVATLRTGAEATHDTDILFDACRLGHHVALTHGDSLRAETEVALAAGLAEGSATPSRLFRVEVMRAASFLAAGRIADVDAALANVAAGSSAVGTEMAGRYATAIAFGRAWIVGSVDEGLLDGLADRVTAAPDVALWRAMLAGAHAMRGDLVSARTEVERFLAIGSVDEPRLFGEAVATAYLFARAAAATDVDPGPEIVDTLLAAPDRVAVVPVGAAPLGAVDGALARLATVRRRSLAVEHFDRAVTAETALGNARLLAASEASYAAYLVDTGDPAHIDRARRLAGRAEATARTHDQQSVLALLRPLGRRLGASGPSPHPGVPGPVPEPPPTEAGASMRLLGRFSLEVDGRPVDLGEVRPQVRHLLWLLAIQPTRALHVEHIIEALWPGADPVPGRRRLHTGLSSLRRVLEPAGSRGAWTVLVRDGDVYRLDLGYDADVDLAAFHRAVGEGRRHRAAGDLGGRAEAFERALDLYQGDLVPEAGPAEWITKPREGRRLDAAEAGYQAAAARLDQGDPSRAARLCRRALEVDPFGDGTWRLLFQSLEAAGADAAAERARSEYDAVLADLDAR